MSIPDFTIQTKVYEGREWGIDFPGRGSAEAWDLISALIVQHPEHVVIPETARINEYELITQPHPECRAAHDYRRGVRAFTQVTCRVFPDVAPEHRSVVASIGKTANVVRVPIIPELTLTEGV